MLIEMYEFVGLFGAGLFLGGVIGYLFRHYADKSMKDGI